MTPCQCSPVFLSRGGLELVHCTLSFLGFPKKSLCPVQPHAKGYRSCVHGLRSGQWYSRALGMAVVPQEVSRSGHHGTECALCGHRPQDLHLAWWYLVLLKTLSSWFLGSPRPSGTCWVSWRPHRFCLRHGPQCGTNAHHPLVIATSTHWGGRWRDLYPLEPGCWGTPKAMECPEPQFPSFPALLGSGAQSPGQGGDSGRAL